MRKLFVLFIILICTTNITIANNNSNKYVKCIDIPKYFSTFDENEILIKRKLNIPGMYGEDYNILSRKKGNYYHYLHYQLTNLSVTVDYYNDVEEFRKFLMNPGTLGISAGFYMEDAVGYFARRYGFDIHTGEKRGGILFTRKNVLIYISAYNDVYDYEMVLQMAKGLDQKILNNDEFAHEDKIVTFGKPQEIWQTPLPRKNVMVGVDTPLHFDIHKGKQVFNTVWTSKANYNVPQRVDGSAEVIYKNNDYIGNDIFYYACILEGEEVVAVSREINVGLSKVNGFEDY